MVTEEKYWEAVRERASVVEQIQRCQQELIELNASRSRLNNAEYSRRKVVISKEQNRLMARNNELKVFIRQNDILQHRCRYKSALAEMIAEYEADDFSRALLEKHGIDEALLLKEHGRK